MKPTQSIIPLLLLGLAVLTVYVIGNHTGSVTEQPNLAVRPVTPVERSIANSNICHDLAAAVSGDFNFAFQWAGWAFVKACNANPEGPKLFPNDPNHEKHLKAYCNYNPALRLCLVCGVLASGDNSDTKLKSAFASCQDLVLNTEPDFAESVLN